jgi:hypothetical protein
MDTTKIETMIAERLPEPGVVLKQMEQAADEAARSCQYAHGHAYDCHQAVRAGDATEARIRAASAAAGARAAAESAARAWTLLPYLPVLNDEARRRAAYLAKEASQEAGVAAQYASGAAYAACALTRD